MTESVANPGRGGARPGAGRPAATAKAASTNRGTVERMDRLRRTAQAERGAGGKGDERK